MVGICWVTDLIMMMMSIMIIVIISIIVNGVDQQQQVVPQQQRALLKDSPLQIILKDCSLRLQTTRTLRPTRHNTSASRITLLQVTISVVNL